MSAIQDLAPFIGAYQGEDQKGKRCKRDDVGGAVERVRRFLLCREPIIRWNTSGSTAL